MRYTFSDITISFFIKIWEIAPPQRLDSEVVNVTSAERAAGEVHFVTISLRLMKIV